jgi:hypothetical protein
MSAKRSRSTLFLMEQLIVVAVFAVCAAACVKILTASYFMANETRDKSNAIKVAESGAECYKATSGDIAATAELIGGTVSGSGGYPEAVLYYNEDWVVCGEGDAAYLFRLISYGRQQTGASALSTGQLSVEKLTGEVIVSFPVASR